MKNLLIVASIGISLHLGAQQRWNNSGIKTFTLNGTVGIGYDGPLQNPVDPEDYRLKINNTLTNSGIYNFNDFSSQINQYGLQNHLISSGTSGTKFGISNTVQSNTDGITYGEYANVKGEGKGSVRGFQSVVGGPGTGTKYGMVITVDPANNGSPLNYGLHATCEGYESRAGFFKGNVEISNGFQVFSAPNGRKSLMLHNQQTGEFVFAANTNNSDWNWERCFIFEPNGKVTKRTNLTNEIAFRITNVTYPNQQDVFRVYGNGTLHATEIFVHLADAFPDYVFSPSYKLMPLKELDSYITANHHLPEMPTAAHVAENGMNVNQVTSKLVEKVEELTLYLIELQKTIELQQQRIVELESK